MMSHSIKDSATIMCNGTNEEIFDGEDLEKMEANYNGSITNGTLHSILEENDREGWDVNFKNSTRFWVQFVLIPVVVVAGMVGNVVTTCVLMRKQMQTPSNIYLTSLAFSDLLLLAFSFSTSWMHYDFMKDVLLYWQYIPFGFWITAALNSTSVWLTVSFTIERYIAVCHPLTGRVNCIRKRAKYVSSGVFLLCFLLTSSTIFEWEVVTKEIFNADSFKTCGLNKTVYSIQNTDQGNNSRYQLLFHWFIIIFLIIIPFFILAITNIFLIQAVQESRRIRESMTNSQQQNPPEDRIVFTLILAVILFFICQSPTAVLRIYTSLSKPVMTGSAEENVLLGIEDISKLLVTINAACNFLLYTALSDRFKRAFNTIMSSWNSRDIPMNVI